MAYSFGHMTEEDRRRMEMEAKQIEDTDNDLPRDWRGFLVGCAVIGGLLIALTLIFVVGPLLRS